MLDGIVKHNDEIDAELCARLAFVFAGDFMTKRGDNRLLHWPTEKQQIDAAENEGWIWVPNQPIQDIFPNVIMVND